ncbi:NAD-dependent deacetylase [Helicobacter pylori]|nr:NAD-dependent deacetylase [Helicobacter pylori]
MKNLVILSGAGISAESGIKTFRDADGLWEGMTSWKLSRLMAGKRTHKRCWIFTTKGADSFLKFIQTKPIRL